MNLFKAFTKALTAMRHTGAMPAKLTQGDMLT